MGARTEVASSMQRMMKVCFMKGRRLENRGRRERKKPTSPTPGYDLNTAIRPIMTVERRSGWSGNLMERGAT